MFSGLVRFGFTNRVGQFGPAWLLVDLIVSSPSAVAPSTRQHSTAAAATRQLPFARGAAARARHGTQLSASRPAVSLSLDPQIAGTPPILPWIDLVAGIVNPVISKTN